MTASGAPSRRDVLRGRIADRGRHVRLGPVDDVRGLRGHEADARRLPLQQPRSERAPLHGVGGGHVHPRLRHGRADGLLRRLRERGRVRALGLEHGGDAPDPVDARHRPPHQRAARAHPHAVDVRAPHHRPVRRGADLPAGHGSRDPELRREPHRPERRGEPGLRRQARQLPHGQHRHRLRAAPGARAGAAGAPRQRRPGLAAELVRRLRHAGATTRSSACPSSAASHGSGSRRWPPPTPTRRPR